MHSNALRTTRWRALLAAAVAVVGVTACDAITGCKKSTSNLDVRYSNDWYTFDTITLSSYERRGYDCRSAGYIYDGFGRTIGSKYVCEKKC